MYRVTSTMMLLSQLLFAVMTSAIATFYAGYSNTCKITDGDISCWGAGSQGQNGYDSTGTIRTAHDTPIFDDFYVESASVGEYDTCAVGTTYGSANKSVRCWGRNSYGELGYGHTDKIGTTAGSMASCVDIDLGQGFYSVESVAVSWSWSCAVSSDGEVKCWGSGTNGQLGQGDTVHRGDDSGEMGDNLPETNLGTGFDAKVVTCGVDYCCSLSTLNLIKCWGQGSRLGLGISSDQGDQADEMGDNLNSVDLGDDWVPWTIGTGYWHTCVIGYNGTSGYNHSVKCWGGNAYGQLGLGDTSGRGMGANQMGDYLPEVDLGDNFDAIEISLAVFSSCFLSSSGGVKCFGSNNKGELGYGDTVSRGVSSEEMGNALQLVNVGTGFVATAISVPSHGGYHTCVADTSDCWKCWGRGAEGQLGYGGAASLGDGSNEMGDYLECLAFPTTSPTNSPTTAPTVQSVSPTAAPSQSPVPPPTSVPTTSPSVSPTDTVCDAADMYSLNWHDLHHVEGAAYGIVHESSVEFNASSLSLTMSLTAEYVGESSAGNLNEDYDLGTTYWIDFGSFQDSPGSLAEPGSCSNRRSDDYTNLTFGDFWGYTLNPDDLESSTVADRMAYPPSNWTLSARNCTVVEYQRTFSWTELTKCTDGGGEGLIQITQTEDEIVLDGTFFVVLVSPYSSSSTGYYRSFSLIQRDFEIALNRQVNVLSSTGVQLFVSSILAFGQRDGGYEMLLLVESADFIELGMDDAVTVISSPLPVSDVETITTGCLVASSFTCAQIFSVIIPANCSNVTSAVDLSGDYQFGFNPQCRTFDDGSTDEACDVFLDSLDDSGIVVLDATSVFVDDCAADLFSVTFDGNLTFYVDDGFVYPVDAESDPFVVGWDTIYGQIVVDFPVDPASNSTDIYRFMNVSIETVFVCTSSDPDELASSLNSADTVGVGGCLSSLIDSDGPYHVIGSGKVEEYEGTIYDVNAPNVARFSFLTFDVPRTNLSVHVQLLLTLQTESGVTRRRMLLENVDSNQIRHFIGSTYATAQQPAEEGFGVGMVVGTTMGGVVMVGMVVFVMMMLRKRTKKESKQKKSGMAKVVHVPDLSPSEVPPTTSDMVNV